MRGGKVEAVNVNGLLGAGVAGGEGKVGRGDLEDVREQLEDGVVGAAVFGGLGDLDFQSGAQTAGELGAAGVGDDFDVEEKGLAFLGEHGGRVAWGAGNDKR